MNKASKLLVAVAAASGIVAYIVNKVSSKKDETLFEDTMKVYRSDVENMSFDEIGTLISKLPDRIDPSQLSSTEMKEYFKAVQQFSVKIQNRVSDFLESGELSDKEADLIRQTFKQSELYADYGARLID